MITQSEALLPTIELNEIPTKQDAGKNPIACDRGHWTYHCCIAGLACCYAAGVACVVLASGVLGHSKPKENQHAGKHDWPEVSISPVAGEVLPLAINVVVTALIEATGLVHATTLRWALGRRLTFNSNLRLFASARSCFALGPVANAIHAALLIMAYTSTSLLFAVTPPENFCQLRYDLINSGFCTESVHFSPPALGFLAVSLLGQASLATWQITSVTVPTWSTCPLNTAWASVEKGTRFRRSGRCMASVHDGASPSIAQSPTARQKSAYAAHKQVRRVLWYTVALSVGSIMWFAILFALIKAGSRDCGPTPWKYSTCGEGGVYEGSNWNPLPDHSGVTSTAIITEHGFVAVFLTIYVFQTFLTMALYCAELITSLSRDEATWRKCHSRTTYKARPNAVLRAATSWAAVTLFALKSVLHWLFGKAMTYTYNWGIFMRTPQLLYLSIGTILLVAFVMYLALERPNGPQPATYGHLQTIVDLVDEWHVMMFWGDKGLHDVGNGTRHAGTSDTPLGGIEADAYYS